MFETTNQHLLMFFCELWDSICILTSSSRAWRSWHDRGSAACNDPPIDSTDPNIRGKKIFCDDVWIVLWHIVTINDGKENLSANFSDVLWQLLRNPRFCAGLWASNSNVHIDLSAVHRIAHRVGRRLVRMEIPWNSMDSPQILWVVVSLHELLEKT